MTSVTDDPSATLEATAVPDLIAAAQATIDEAQARAARVGERRAALTARLGAAKAPRRCWARLIARGRG